MKSFLIAALAVGAAAACGPAALANDTTAVLGTGGLVFITSETLKMKSEDLFVSPDEVRVTYQFENLSDEAQDVLVAFPMPDIDGGPEFNVSVPDREHDNLFGFSTSFGGSPVEATLHQQAFAFNLDQSRELEAMGVPLLPFGETTRAALDALDEEQIARLKHLGMIAPITYSTDGETWQTSHEPMWTLRSTYSWEARFEPGETVEVVHRYTPSVGGTVAVTFMGEPNEYEDRARDYKDKYCTDDSFLNAVKRTMTAPDEPYSAPFTESWISYVWSTGNNWAGPIETFTLTVDKGDARNLVSFCWDGKVTKTGPTTFTMEAEDWYPPWNRELEILILNRYDPSAAG